MRRVYTHISLDLDAVASIWATKKFVRGFKGAKVVFVSANWDGDGMEINDLAVDIRAGGQGIKGEEETDGTTHSCFASLILKYASPEIRQVLAPLIAFIDAQDISGVAVQYLAPELNSETSMVLESTGLNAIFRSLQSRHPRNDLLVLKRMSEIFDGILLRQQARQRAERDADLAYFLPGGKVAIIDNPSKSIAVRILFERGIRVVVYIDGYNLRLNRHPEETLCMSHPKIRAVVEAASEADQWFSHPAGFLFCRGSRKAPVKSPSRVDPCDLAKAVASLL